MNNDGKYIFTVNAEMYGIVEVRCNHPDEIYGELYPNDPEYRQYEFLSVRETIEQRGINE